MSVLPAPEEKAAVVEAMFDRVAPSYERLNHLISGGQDRRWRHRLVRDLALAPRFAAVAAVEKLARLHRDFRSLLCNFVNFADFYSRDRWAVFQAGTLYLDGRSTELCVRVEFSKNKFMRVRPRNVSSFLTFFSRSGANASARSKRFSASKRSRSPMARRCL